MLMSAPLATAKSAIAAKSFVETDSGPTWTTSSSGPEEPARSSVGTTIDASRETAR